MRKILVFFALILASCQAQAQIPPLTGPGDPSQLIATINQLIAAINTQAYSQAFPTPAGGMSTVPNSIVLTAAASGSSPQITPTSVANGGDANVSILLSPSGTGNLILFRNNNNTAYETGILQFANAASFVPRSGLAACPGFSRQAAPVGMSDSVTGYFVMMDWLGRTHYVPTC